MFVFVIAFFCLHCLQIEYENGADGFHYEDEKYANDILLGLQYLNLFLKNKMLLVATEQQEWLTDTKFQRKLSNLQLSRGHHVGEGIIERASSSLSNLPPLWVSLNQSPHKNSKLAPSSSVTWTWENK